MPYETTNTAKLGSLQKFAASIAANIPELPHLEQSCLQFVSMVGNLQEVSKEQAALVADKQEASKKFKTLLIECQRLASVLRAAVKQHYGIRSESPIRGSSTRPKRAATRCRRRTLPCSHRWPAAVLELLR